MSNCKGKNGKVYYRRVKAKVREHMRTCYLKLTLSSVPKSSCKRYFLKELEFTDKRGSKRTTSFVSMESLTSVVE